MGSPISLFSGYSQKENRTTNYCLLILKMIYEEGPEYLSEVLSSLLGDEVSIGVQFIQQKRGNSSVPDGVISQESFTIYIETKNSDWFSDSQLESHLDSLDKEDGSDTKILIALSNFEKNDDNRFRCIENICRKKYNNKIVFKKVSFEDYVGVLDNISDKLPRYLSASIGELRSYLDEQGLLPVWKQTIDIVNCAGSKQFIEENKAYVCLASGGAYSHRRCKYFGVYSNKKVEKVAEIRAVIDYDMDDNSLKKLWINTDEREDVLFNEAKELADAAVTNGQITWKPIRIFLLSDLYDTEFIKDSKGGMYSSKIYMQMPSDINNAENLADYLRNKKWSDIR